MNKYVYLPFSGGDFESFKRYVDEQFRRIDASQPESQPLVILDELHAAPPKLREGMVVFADGTDWNPGSGQGFYGYRGGAWNFLG